MKELAKKCLQFAFGKREPIPADLDKEANSAALVAMHQYSIKTYSNTQVKVSPEEGFYKGFIAGVEWERSHEK